MKLVENELGHYKLCEKWEFQKAENETCISQRKSSNQMSTRSHITVQTDKCLEHNRPDIAVIDNKNKRCQQINTSCTFDSRIERKEEGNA